jgi:hypothetical protein
MHPATRDPQPVRTQQGGTVQIAVHPPSTMSTAPVT